ncbi:MAG: Cna B-type domain-containing protein [Eubacterium sp.]|nr:Cna B-type domain-containing protein [Eubacterium sp.]
MIDNTLQAYNYNGKAYDHIGMSDYMTGAQVALVPVLQNPDLKAPDGSSLDTYTANGVTYYLLNKPGEYKNVTFGRKTGTNNNTERNGVQNWKADITVTESVSGGKRTGLNTLFIWDRFENWGGTSAYTYMHYKTLVSAEKAGLAGADNPGEVKQYDLKNKAWLGDHQGHRLWDTMGFYTQVYSFSKKILTKSGTLADFSRVRQADTVTYQITINNTSTAPTVLNGTRIYDNLPNNKGVFSWEKGVNVKNLRFIASDGVEIKYGSGSDAVNIPTDGTANDYWSINNTTTAGQQQIKWDNNFNIHFPVSGNVKILVDLKFPERTEGVSAWDQYVAELAGKQLTNTFYLDSRYSSVNHLLESEGKAVLYKGVYDNGLTTKHPSYSDSSNYKYGQYISNGTRLMYQNGTGSASVSDPDLKASTITYYTVLYNGSYDRLYLSDLEDELPRGFTYNSMCATANTNDTIWYYSDGNSSYSGYLGYRVRANYVYSENYGNQLVTIDKSKDPYDRNNLTYKSAQVTATVTGTVNGRQHVKFAISNVGYDSEVGKYYLNPGEAVRFGYNVLIDRHAKTDDEATNTITMPYYDYYGTGFNLDVPDKEGNGGAIQKARAVSGITPNDGKCELMTADQVSSEFGMNVSKYADEAYNSNPDGNFMVSSVTVHRAPITPGLQKTIGGLSEKSGNPTETTIEGPSSGYGTAYKGGAKVSDVINWKLRMFNEAPGKNAEANGMMTDYTIVDTVDSPFGFTGRIYYDMYRNTSSSGTKVTKSTQYLFTIGSRKIAENEAGRDTKIRFSSGNTLTASGYRDVNIGSAEDDSDDDWFSFGSGAKSGKVKLERNAKGKEILTIKLTGPGYSIPAGYWIDMCVHTMYTLDEVIISEPKYNSALLYPEQDYDPATVVQGRARTKQVMNDDGTIETKNDGIQSGASIMLNQGFMTSSWKEITETDDPLNKAKSDDSKNYIVLSEKSKTFKYDLYVIGPSASISKMIIIDDLPHVGDHSAFVEDDKRESEFKVGFLESDLGLRVALARKTGESGGVNTYGNETVLNRSQYDVYISNKTEFDRNTDWIGTGDGWTNIADLEGDALKEALRKARSIRVVVKDPEAWQTDTSKYMLYREARIHISFNAKIDDKNAQPGQIAWNSFGYKYQLPLSREGYESEKDSWYLEAQPLNVGLKYPNAPLLTKKLSEEVTRTVEKKDENGNVIMKPVLDENGNPKRQPVLDEEGNPVQRQVVDGEGHPITDDSGNPVMETVMEDVMEPETEEVTEIVAHKAEQDLKYRFIIYEGDPIGELDDPSELTDDQIAANLATRGIKFVYLPYEIKKGESEKEIGLWTIDHCSRYDAETESFTDAVDSEGNKIPWQWKNGQKYTVLELSMGDYNYKFDSITVDGKKFEKNNTVFANNTDIKMQLVADNRYQPEYVDVSGTKTWVDNDDKAGKRPEKITVNLFANGEKVDSKDFTPDDDGSWSFKFEHLLKEKEDGTHITYTVTEEPVRYYDTEISDPETDENGNVTSNITNTLNYVEINVEKKWDDRDDIAKIRPDEITVHLLSAEWKQKLDDQGEPVLDDNDRPVYEAPAEEDFKEIDSAVIKEDEDGNWSKLFKDLPDHNKDGVKIEYKVTEDEVDYYDTTIDQETDSTGIVTTFTVTNTLNYMEVTGTKVWDDQNNAAGLRPGQITVRLMRNQFDESGKEIVDENGKPVLIPATRQIMDENGEPVLDENGKPTYEEITAKLPDAQGSWEFRFDQLMMADDKGNMINYVVEEDRVPHYKEPVVESVTKYVVDENGEYVLDDEGNKIEDQINKEFRITNSIELTEVSVEKYWDDYNDSAGLRPGEITVELLADGKVADTVKVTAEQDWKHTFANLPKVDANWNEIKYTVSEQPVADYETAISPAGDGKFTITNRCLYIDLLLTKKMPERFSTGSGKNSTVAFRVEGKDKDGNIVYQNTVGFAFNEKSGASETKVLKKVPIDAEYTVTEIYSGSYTPKQAEITKKEVEQYDGEYRGYRGRTVWLFEFENDIGESGTGDNGGIVNNYSDNGSGVRFEGGEE